MRRRLGQRPKRQRFTPFLALVFLLLTACGGPTLKKDIERDAPTFAAPPAEHGPLFDIAATIASVHGADHSGFRLLHASRESLDWRLALIDSAVETVRILTNSLASHDVPAVNSHYRPWRDDFIEAGAELFELRADAKIQALVDVPPMAGKFVGLHSKAFVVDRELSFIGSMNFDPRSVNINSEGGVYVESEGRADSGVTVTRTVRMIRFEPLEND